MRVSEIIKELNLDVKSGASSLDTEITGGYVSDLLSDVIGNSKPGNIWVTLQVHQNIVAVASLKELSGIIIVQGRCPDDETIMKADIENVPIMVSSLSTFELVGRIYKLLKC